MKTAGRREGRGGGGGEDDALDGIAPFAHIGGGVERKSLAVLFRAQDPPCASS